MSGFPPSPFAFAWIRRFLGKAAARIMSPDKEQDAIRQHHLREAALRGAMKGEAPG
jgi:hypothetical protein